MGSFSSVLPPVPRPSLGNSHLIFKNHFTRCLPREACPAFPGRGPFSLAVSAKGRGSTALTDSLVVKYLGEAAVRVLAPKLPHVKERLPVDVAHQRLQVVVLEDPRPKKRGLPCRRGQPRSAGPGPGGAPTPRTWDARSWLPRSASTRSPQMCHQEGPHTGTERASSAASRQ